MEKFRGASALGSQTTAASAPRMSTEFDSVSDALSFAQEIAGRVENLADRLLGSQPQPQDASNGGISGTPDGILTRMATQAQYTRGRLGDAAAALERIERALP